MAALLAEYQRHVRMEPGCRYFGAARDPGMRAKIAVRSNDKRTDPIGACVGGFFKAPDPAEIGWASFACILLRGEMVSAIGPMDEGYFLYFEDAEYCLRARRAGWRVAYVPEARVVHFRGGSGPVKALARARTELGGQPEVDVVLEFMETSERGVVLA